MWYYLITCQSKSMVAVRPQGAPLKDPVPNHGFLIGLPQNLKFFSPTPSLALHFL